MKLSVIINKQDPTKDGLYPIVIRVSHKGSRLFHYIGFRTREEWWEDDRVSKKHPNYKLVNTTIENLVSNAVQKITQAKVTGKPVNPKSLFKEEKSHFFGQYIESLREHYLKRQQYVIYRKSARFKKEIIECFGSDIYFEELTAEALRKLEAFMIDNENSANTRHKKFKFYSAYFNKAQKEGLTEMSNPFEDYEIKTEKSYKEKLTAEEIAIIEKLELQGKFNDTRNLFLFSYYCKGMRFENCITAKWNQVKNGRIHFQLVKSYKPMSVKIHTKLQAILDQYPMREFIFPFITDRKTGLQGVKQIDSLNTIVNRYLKDVMKSAGITKKISFHNSRHSFAYNMKKAGQSTEVIKDHLGHSRSTVTEQYLQSLDDELLDDTLKNFYE